MKGARYKFGLIVKHFLLDCTPLSKVSCTWTNQSERECLSDPVFRERNVSNRFLISPWPFEKRWRKRVNDSSCGIAIFD